MEDEVVQVQERRDVIEQAFESAETSTADAPAASPAPATAAPAPAVVADGAAAAPVAPAADKPADAPAVAATEPDAEKQVAVDRAPQSWRAPQKAKWASLDPEVRQEVTRREREVERALGESAQARRFSQSVTQAIQPYVANLQRISADPVVALQELARADHMLSTTPKVQRARLMAQYIKDYDIDITELDNALAGKPEADPVDAKVEQLLQQRLAPFQQFLQQQADNQQQQVRQTDQQIATSIEAMATNPKYEHFEALREDMADIVDIAAKRGVYLTLEQAYERASGMNPEVSKLVAAKTTAETKTAAALASNALAQKALGASVSVAGSPSSVPSNVPAGSDRRAAIEAAFAATEGR